MTTGQEEPAAVPRSVFQVTHYLRPAQAGSGWAQSQSGELSREDAVSWIDDQAAEAADLGFTDGPADAAPAPTAGQGVTTTVAPDTAGAPAGDSAPALGDS